MALSEHERYRFERSVRAYIEARRPPPHIRPELDLGYRFVGQSIEVFETRPAYQRPDEKIEHPIAKATYIKSRNVWKIYWMRADLQWHRYEPQATVPTIDDVVAVIDQDPYGCFFG
ncbi:MAG: DUF3024 domain-containing protein [Gammaproteobacteria bacterium]|nr:DUF3024 domain-containing protein [Gammaproteobacteria bacterium]